jgi:hypothetical protein
MKGIICILAAGALFTGCATTSSNPQKAQAKARAAQLHVGMTPNQVERLLGHPDKVDQDDGYHHGHAYIPYYGWHHSGYHGDEMKWEYKSSDIEVVFRRSGDGWVVKEWDR